MLDMRSAIHVHEDDLELYLRGRLEFERTSFVEHHLLECSTCRECLIACLGNQVALRHLQRKSASEQKRFRSCFRTEGDAMLQEIHPLSLDRQKVMITNNSKSGPVILSPKAILSGTVVQLRTKDSVELGHVRYCSANHGQGFRIGLRLHDED